MIVAQTPRLLLRSFTWDDVDDMARIRADPVVMTFLGGPRTYADTKQQFESILNSYEKDSFDLWAIIHKADNSFIGRCGLMPQVVDGLPENEMGYILASEYWGRGLATEAARAVRDYGFKQRGFNRLIALIAPDNIASQNVAMKVGLTYEKSTTMGGKMVLVYVLHKAAHC